MSYNHMESPWIKMKAKYKGSTCDNETCEKKIDVGQMIFWNKNTHRVRHENCHLEQVDEHTSDTSFVPNSFAKTDEFDWKKPEEIMPDRYNKKLEHNPVGKQIGMIAQEVQKVIPELVEK